ncbi:MAG: hypothetical protein RIT31_814, partial [Actinomycetota bacterium]
KAQDQKKYVILSNNLKPQIFQTKDQVYAEVINTFRSKL